MLVIGETITRMHFSRLCLYGSVAQLVEQWSEEPRVDSSILSGSTNDIIMMQSIWVTSQNVESSILLFPAVRKLAQ